MSGLTPPSVYKSLEFDVLRRHLAGLAGTVAGRERLEKQEPTPDRGWVQSELERVGEMRGLWNRGQSIEGGQGDLRPLLRRAAVAGSALNPDELLLILHNLRAHRSARRVLDRERRQIPRLYELTTPLKSVPDLEETLERALSPEGTLRDTASPELSRLRKAIAAQMDALRERITALIPKLARLGALREESFTIRDGRYVLPVRSDALGKVRGIIHDRSATGATLFVEPAALIEAGNLLRALELAERDEIHRILTELTGEVRARLEQIEANEAAMTALDVISAKARLAEQLDAHPPGISSTGAIRLVQARHPLLSLDPARTVVPLNLELGVNYTTLVLSGPNAGGKSVALKCVGLLSLMTACGLEVPAAPGTEIPLFRKVLALVGDQQSIADDLSTFTAHAAALRLILEEADDQTLVLIDEIGAGTDPHEGSALSIAVLERLTARRTLTMVTTHHSALKVFADTTPGCANGSMDFDTANFQPTYQFRPSVPGSSYALEIARRSGLPKDIVNRAREVLGTKQFQLDQMISRLSDKIREYENLLEGQEERIARIRTAEEDYNRRLERLEKRERELRQRAAVEIQEIVKQARRTVEKVVKELRQSAADREAVRSARQALEALSRQAEDLHPASIPPAKTSAASAPVRRLPEPDVPQPPPRLPPLEPIPDKTPEPGDWVRIDNGPMTGQVTLISGRGDRVCVAVGSVQLWVSRDRVTVVTPPEPESPIRVFASLPDVPLELDVRGLDAPEATRRVERYLEDGYAAGREKLGIVHGKGMGVLSRHIRQHLKSHPLVASFRFGDYGEGDYGITIVELKR